MIFLRGFALVLSLALATVFPFYQACGLDAEVIPEFGLGELTGVLRDVDKGSELSDDAEIRCPQCGSEDVIEIVYGYPTEETLERAEAGEVRLGGCVVGYCDPNRYCKSCGYEWRQ